jgi:ATP-dependent protease ClpP protease subunit
MDLTRINLNIKYHCICIKAISSGFYIYQLCDYRYWINGFSTFLIHEPKLNIQGTFEFVSNYIKTNFENDYSNYKTILTRIYSKSNLNKNIYNNKTFEKDWIISSNIDVKIYNFADFYI